MFTTSLYMYLTFQQTIIIIYNIEFQKNNPEMAEQAGEHACYK